MSYEFITVEQDGPLTLVMINRPERMNALHRPANDELESAFNAFEADDDQWVAIITGAGEKAFCAGNDLRHQAEGGGLAIPPTGFGGLTQRYSCTKPVIAAVNGVAMGGGLEIALACDIVVAAETAIFALPEVKVGLAALAGGLHRLPREIGLKRALHMILTGRRVTAAEALELGFVNAVVPAADVMKEARRLAAEILAASPMSVRASKEAVYRGLNGTLETAQSEQWKYPAMKAMFKSQDIIEGPRAFAEKRPPQWRGK